MFMVHHLVADYISGPHPDFTTIEKLGQVFLSQATEPANWCSTRFGFL